MPVSLSIKNVPEDLLERLRERARRNHRSLQGELLSILTQAVEPTPRRTVADVRALVRALDLPGRDLDSAALVRDARDRRGRGD